MHKKISFLLLLLGVQLAACQPTSTLVSVTPSLPAATNAPVLPSASPTPKADLPTLLPAIADGQLYQSQEPAFQLMLPASWQPQDLGEGYQTFTGAAFDNFVTNLTIFSETSELSLQDYAATSFASVLQSLPDAKVTIEAEQLRLQNITELGIHLAITRPKSPIQIIQDFYIVALANQAKLTLTCSYATTAPVAESSALCRSVVEQIEIR